MQLNYYLNFNQKLSYELGELHIKQPLIAHLIYYPNGNIEISESLSITQYPNDKVLIFVKATFTTGQSIDACYQLTLDNTSTQYTNFDIKVYDDF